MKNSCGKSEISIGISEDFHKELMEFSKYCKINFRWDLRTSFHKVANEISADISRFSSLKKKNLENCVTDFLKEIPKIFAK